MADDEISPDARNMVSRTRRTRAAVGSHAGHGQRAMDGVRGNAEALQEDWQDRLDEVGEGSVYDEPIAGRTPSRTHHAPRIDLPELRGHAVRGAQPLVVERGSTDTNAKVAIVVAVIAIIISLASVGYGMWGARRLRAVTGGSSGGGGKFAWFRRNKEEPATAGQLTGGQVHHIQIPPTPAALQGPTGLFR